MPNLIVGYQLTDNNSKTRLKPSTINYQLSTTKANGFSLIEIVLSMFVILALVSIIFTVSGTYATTRRSSLQTTAGKIATRQIETLRKTAYDSLPANCTTPSGCTFTDSDTSKLPSSTAKHFIDVYQSSADMRQIKIQIAWVESGVNKSFTTDTLIYKNGL